MKRLLIILSLFCTHPLFSQSSCENIFIITTDGMRWQELFNGADSMLLFDPKFVKDTSTLPYLYWGESREERRKKLMPFTWNYIARKGQLWGNRNFGNCVSVANPYRLSYAGYNEMLTGYADPAVMANKPKYNTNANLLQYLNTTDAYKGKVAFFGSWKLFSFILNGQAAGIPLNCGYQPVSGDSLSFAEQAANYIQANSAYNSLPTRSDLLTFTLATEYIQQNHPKVMYIGFGETDEFAHKAAYDNYLSQINQFDKFLAELWSLIQRDDFYKGKTRIFITTDHGRGSRPDKWMKHGMFTAGSDETWLLQLGAGIEASGEMKMPVKMYNEQFAETIARYLGKSFEAAHPVAERVYSLVK